MGAKEIDTCAALTPDAVHDGNVLGRRPQPKRNRIHNFAIESERWRVVIHKRGPFDAVIELWQSMRGIER